MLFYDRQDAGHQLVAALSHYKGQQDTLVLGLARGGVVVAYEVAKALSLPLNVVSPRKIGAPGNPELALGSIMENGEGVFNDAIIRMLGVPQHYINQEMEKEKAKAQQRLNLYRQFAPLPDVKGKTVILVDDGVATGSTMLAAIKGMRKAGAKQIVVAVPVAASDTLPLLEKTADEVVCSHSREDFIGVGMYYRSFEQTDDSEVIALLKEANQT